MRIAEVKHSVITRGTTIGIIGRLLATIGIIGRLLSLVPFSLGMLLFRLGVVPSGTLPFHLVREQGKKFNKRNFNNNIL